ncbi:MAG: hypothetical protein PHQ50_01500 [Eubacteriales bacterium]|nr:hypothetical protein [Eubacteriales bacterium]
MNLKFFTVEEIELLNQDMIRPDKKLLLLSFAQAKKNVTDGELLSTITGLERKIQTLSENQIKDIFSLLPVDPHTLHSIYV